MATKFSTTTKAWTSLRGDEVAATESERMASSPPLLIATRIMKEFAPENAPLVAHFVGNSKPAKN